MSWYIDEPLPRVRPGAFGMGEVVAPQHVADADLVAPVELAASMLLRADEAVPVEVRRSAHGEPPASLRLIFFEVCARR